ncbi:hypothetical protein CR513_00838, partial [Mucuna pruriens]
MKCTPYSHIVNPWRLGTTLGPLGLPIRSYKMGFIVYELFHVWQINFMSPFPKTFSNEYILVAVDYIAKWFENLLSKYGVTHKVTTPYHLQTSGQVEISNMELKMILEKTLNASRKDWSLKITFKTPIRISLYKLVFGKICHLLIELEHKALWALQFLNFDSELAKSNRLMQLDELDKLRVRAYENSRLYKEK